MTTNEVETMLKYLVTLYPNARMNEQQFQSTVSIWSKELKNETCKQVGEALRVARIESPDWMPTLSKIQQSLSAIKSSIKLKSPEMEYKDSHCGKTKNEWESMSSWNNSPEGERKIESYRQRLSKLLGGTV